MKKGIFTYIFCLITLSIIAQQDAYSWRVGAYSGFNIYRGDLNSDLNPFDVSHPLTDVSYENRFDLLSYGASIEYSTKGFGLKLLGTRGIFRAEDRAINRDGDFINHTNFNRSLNVENQFYDASILATFYSDNGRLLSKTAFVSPYISIGLGGTAFETFGDLEDANGNTYYYWSDGKIYNKPEDTQPTDAIEVNRDFHYETDLEILDPEGIFYSNLVWNVPIAVGLKFRITDRLNANLEVLGRYTSTDYLDGVSTRGNADDNDFYGMTSLSLHYNFGRKSDNFLPPTFYSLGEDETTKDNITTTKPQIEVETKPEKVISKIDSNVEKEKSIVEKVVTNEPKIEIPKKKIDTQKVDIVENQPKLETVKKDVDKQKIKIVETPKIEKLEIVETPTFLLNDKSFSVEKQTYLEVQQTRLEVATLNEEANILLENYDATKVDSFMILNQKIDSLSQKLEAYQQYMIQLAVQGNADYTKPENQAIEKQVSSLEGETEALRQKYRVLVLGEDDPKAVETALEKIEKENEANKAKIKALEAEVAVLEQQKKTTNIETSKSERTIENITLITPKVNVDTSKTIIRGTAGDNPVLPILSDSMAQVVNIYEAKLQTLSNEVNRLNTEVIPEKDETIQFLNTKVVELQGELKGIKETNKYYADLFQKQITALQQQIAKLNQRQPTIVTEPKVVEKIVQIPTEPKIIEKIVEVPATTTVSIADLVKEFGVTNVYFDNGSTTVKSEFNGQLNRVASMMQQHPEIIVILKGYTDKSGNPELNLRLSKKRGEAVKSYLKQKGITASRIDVSYFGENAANATNDAFSRRVEVQMIVN
ncbi:MAG: DUF6089 family protein [Saprospiraceae bacterium]